jgi:hypothetical protein
MISGQGKAGEGDKHEYSVHPFQNKLMEYTYLKNTLSFLRYVKCLCLLCVKQIKQIRMSRVVQYSGALFGCLWKNSTH